MKTFQIFVVLALVLFLTVDAKGWGQGNSNGKSKGKGKSKSKSKDSKSKDSKNRKSRDGGGGGSWSTEKPMDSTWSTYSDSSQGKGKGKGWSSEGSISEESSDNYWSKDDPVSSTQQSTQTSEAPIVDPQSGNETPEGQGSESDNPVHHHPAAPVTVSTHNGGEVTTARMIVASVAVCVGCVLLVSLIAGALCYASKRRKQPYANVSIQDMDPATADEGGVEFGATFPGDMRTLIDS